MAISIINEKKNDDILYIIFVESVIICLFCIC